MCASIRYDNLPIYIGAKRKYLAPSFDLQRRDNYTMEKSLNRWKDTLGIVASVACAVHCAATPILIAFLPALTFTEWMANPRFHQIAAVVCVGMVALAIWPAFMRFRDYRVLSLSTGGLGLIIAAAFFLPNECCSHSHAVASTTDLHAGHKHAADGLASHSLTSDHATESETVFASLASPALIAIVQPWMTPLGGLLLVVAHGLNLRRRVCNRKGCNCLTNSASKRSESTDAVLVTANTKAAY